jgi:hypothetical protein
MMFQLIMKADTLAYAVRQVTIFWATKCYSPSLVSMSYAGARIG